MAKKVHGAQNIYRIPDTFHEELRIERKILADESIRLETPMAHIVPRDPTYTAFAHATPLGAVGWSTDLGFRWQLKFEQEVTRRASATDVRKKRRIPLDAIKMVAVTANMATTLCTYNHGGLNLSNHPILLNVCNNLLVGE